MIHIATIHWKTDKWIRIQLSYLKKNMRLDYRTYAYLNGIDPEQHSLFDHVFTDEIRSHAEKLDRLADYICSGNPDDDLILFLDGDAFPIAPLNETFIKKAGEFHLMALQRKENNGDLQPHPAFALTSIGKWKGMAGTWKRGYTWLNDQGQPVTDVGGELLRILDEGNLNWHKMLRSNAHNPHPLYFGVYDDLIYHHGAGFRRGKGGRVSRQQQGEERFRDSQWRKMVGWIPSGRIRYLLDRKERWMKKLEHQMVEMNERYYRKIISNENFYTDLIGRK